MPVRLDGKLAAKLDFFGQDPRRTWIIPFTSGQSGDVIPYAETDTNQWGVVNRFIWRGSDILSEPAEIASISWRQKDTSNLRIYDITNNNVICSGSTSDNSPTIITWGALSNISTTTAIWEFQQMSNQNNRWTRTSSIHIRWNK